MLHVHALFEKNCVYLKLNYKIKVSKRVYRENTSFQAKKNDLQC